MGQGPQATWTGPPVRWPGREPRPWGEKAELLAALPKDLGPERRRDPVGFPAQGREPCPPSNWVTGKSRGHGRHPATLPRAREGEWWTRRQDSDPSTAAARTAQPLSAGKTLLKKAPLVSSLSLSRCHLVSAEGNLPTSHLEAELL